MMRVAVRVRVVVSGLALGFGLSCGRFACTVFAATEKCEVVGFEMEALGGQLFEVATAAGEFKDAAACVAVKVVVVALACELIARALARDVNGQHFVGVDQ
jgi:ABC-type spermidine/putrescine transport system permease subunit II